jgi:hypothetical protein
MSTPTNAAPAQAAASTAVTTPANATVPTEQNLEAQVEGQELETQDGAGEVESTPTEKKAEEKKRLKQLKYKANGKEHVEDLPFEIDDNPEVVEYLTKQFSLARAAQVAMQENNSTKKQVDALFKAMKSDTKSVLKEMGIDPRQLAAEIIEEEIKQSQMTPEQKELEELRAQKKQMEEERQKLKEEAEKEARTKEEQLAYEKISNDIADAIKTTYLPKEPATVRRVAHYLKVANEAGIEVSAAEVMPFVEQDLKAELQSILEQLGEDNFEDFVGKERMSKQRKRNIAKAKSVPTTPATAKAGTVEVKSSAKPEKAEPATKKSFKEFFGV